MQNYRAAVLDLNQAAKNKVANNRAGLFASDALNANGHHTKSRTLKEQLDQSQAYHLERNKYKVHDLLKKHYPNGADQAALNGHPGAAFPESKLLSHLGPLAAQG